MSEKSSPRSGNNKKWIAIAAAGAAVLIAVAVVLIATLGGGGKAKKPPVIGENVFEAGDSFTYVEPAKADDFMHIDGVLDEPEWQDKSVFSTRLSEDLEMTGPHLSLTTHMTAKGLYVGATIEDANIFYNGQSAPSKNSTLFLLIAPEGIKNKAQKHSVYLDLERVISSSNSNVYSAAYAVKVDGKANSGETKGMVMELFVPWSAIGLDAPKNPDKVEIDLYPTYYAAVPGEENTKSLRAFPYVDEPEAYWRFESDGYIDVDREGAVAGDSKIGVAKMGVWDISSLRLSRHNDYSFVYSGGVKTVSERNNLLYLSGASGTSFVFEATFVPGVFTDDERHSAALAVMLPEKRMLTFSLSMMKAHARKNALGLMNCNSISASRGYQDSSTGSGTELKAAYGNPNFETREGVHMKLIRDGTRFYYYVDGELIASEIVSQAGGVGMPAFYASQGRAEFKEIRFESFDGRADALRREFDSSGTCLVETEVQGSGYLTADSLAVKKGESVTVEIEQMPGNILSDIQVNGRSVFSDFAANGVIRGTQSLYTITNIQQHITVKAVYSAYKGVTVTGRLTLAGQTLPDINTTEIYAYLSDHRVISFPSAVRVDGTYSVTLPAGTYQKLYFRHNRFEQIFYTFPDGSPLVVGNAPLTNKNFNLTYSTFDSFVMGENAVTGDWYIVDNGKYAAEGAPGGNDPNIAYFRSSGGENFAVRTTVEADGGYMVGVMLSGVYKLSSGYNLMAAFGPGQTCLFGWHGTARPVNWIGVRSGAFSANKTVYPDSHVYNIVVAKQGDYIMMTVNGVIVAEYDGKISANDGQIFDLSQFTIDKVGLCTRGYVGATFSGYSYSTRAADINAVTSRVVTFNALPAGARVTVDGKAIRSGAAVRYGKTVSVKFSPSRSRAVSVAVNGRPINSDQVTGEASFTVTEDSAITITSKSAYDVSGAVAGSGSVTATNTETGEVYRFGGALKNGKYDIWLPDGKYDIYFDAGDREGILTDVEVKGADISDQSLGRSFPKPGFMEQGEAAPAEWVLTGNGVYSVRTENRSSDKISMAYFDTLPSFSGTDFVLDVTVDTAGDNSLMLGLAFNESGTTRTGVFGMVSGATFATVRELQGGYFKGQRNYPFYFDKTHFRLSIQKTGNRVVYYIGGSKLVEWDITDIDGENLGAMKNVRVGLGIYRTFDVTFSDYSYRRVNPGDFHTISGKVEGVTAGGTVSAAADGTGFLYGGSMNGRGEYSVRAPGGFTYDITVESGGCEGMISDVALGDSDLGGQDLGGMYQKPLFDRFGEEAVFDWRLTDNGTYRIDTDNAGHNSMCGGFLGSAAKLSELNFTLHVRVNAPGGSPIAGLLIAGDDGDTLNESVVLGIVTGDGMAKTLRLKNFSWGADGPRATFDRGDFTLDFTKQGNIVVVRVNGTKLHSWDLRNVNGAGDDKSDITDMTDVRVGFGLYRSNDITFSEYEFNELGDEDYVSVSGRVSGVAAAGTVTATDLATDLQYEGTLAADGSYTVRVPRGSSYSLHFLTGGYEGLIKEVTVGDGDLSGQDLARLYQKPPFERDGADGTFEWFLTDNGTYEIRTGNQDANAMCGGIFATAERFADANFTLAARVRTKGNGAPLIGLMIMGTDGELGEEHIIFGMLNNDRTGRVVRRMHYSWTTEERIQPAVECDPTDYRLTAIKSGNRLVMLIDGRKAFSWDLTDVFGKPDDGIDDLSDMTNVRFGLGFLRSFDVTFSDYEYTPQADFPTISGSVGSGYGEGTVTATDSSLGLTFTGKLNSDGTYSVAVPGGAYKLYFATSDGRYEGLAKSVEVSDGPVKRDLTRLYQKPTFGRYGEDSRFDWELADNGTYNIITDNDSKNAMCGGFFATASKLSELNFTLHFKVKSPGSRAPLIGLMISGTDPVPGADEPVGERIVLGAFANDGMCKSLRLINFSWGADGPRVAFDRNDYTVDILKVADRVIMHINGTKAYEWDLRNVNGKSDNNSDITDMTDVSVGFGIYRNVDTTFYDYEYTSQADFPTISGSVGSGYGEGTVTATDAALGLTFTGKLNSDGTYSVAVPGGTYKLYFATSDGRYEGLANGVEVNGSSVTRQQKLYRKPEIKQYHSEGSYQWNLTDNGRYEIKTGNEMTNSFSAGLFGSGSSFADLNFKLQARVEAPGTSGQIIGLVVSGKREDGGADEIIFGTIASNGVGKSLRLESFSWGVDKLIGAGCNYNRESYLLTVYKVGDRLVFFINGAKAYEWDLGSVVGSDNFPTYDASLMTDVKVGLGIYRSYDTVFSDYEYTEDVTEIPESVPASEPIGDTSPKPAPAPVSLWESFKRLLLRVIRAMF